MSYIYLASPYSDPSPLVRKRRHLEAEAAMHWLLSHRIWTYSPIVQCHFLAEGYELPKGIDFWQNYDMAMIDQASALWVLAIPGHTHSKGVQFELQYADSRRIPIGYVTPLDDGNYRHPPIPLSIQARKELPNA